jgi:O-antigen/teichoic acid export membrane protein
MSGRRIDLTRTVLGGIGVAALGYGGWLIARWPTHTKPISLATWLAGGLILHDGILVPATLIAGAVLTLAVRARARRYLQGFLIVAAVVTVVTVPLVIREGMAQPGQALLTQDYLSHLIWVLAAVGGLCLLAYLVRVARDRRTGPRRHPRGGPPT